MLTLILYLFFPESGIRWLFSVCRIAGASVSKAIFGLEQTKVPAPFCVITEVPHASSYIQLLSKPHSWSLYFQTLVICVLRPQQTAYFHNQ